MPSHDTESSPLVYLVLAALLIGVLSTLWGYEYGIGNQTEYVLMVERALDSDFLARDFFTNTTSHFGPRSYFTLIMASVAALTSVPTAFFLLALVSNIGTSLITALAVRDFFGKSETAGLLASCMVMSLDTLHLGGASTLAWPYLLMATFATPLVLGSLWAGFLGRLKSCAFLAGIASIIHPLVGLGAGCIILGSASLVEFLGGLRQRFTIGLTSLARVISAWLILVLIAAVNVLPYYLNAERIPTIHFIDILARYRNPDHYLPSTFPISWYIEGACFLAATLLSWGMLRRHRQFRPIAECAFLVIAIVLLACLGGYLFVEIIPTRIWTTAQTFRTLALIKWLGYVGIAGVVALGLSRNPETQTRTDAAPMLLGVMSPETMFLTQMVESIRHTWAGRMVSKLSINHFTILLVVVGYLLFLQYVNVTFLLFLLIAYTAVFTMDAFFRASIPILLTCGTAGFLLYGTPVLSEKYHGYRLPKPVFTLDAMAGSRVETAALMRRETPADAVILTPPNFHLERLLSRRAIVADFNMFPFRDIDMLKWYQRMIDCYGPVSGGGGAARSAIVRRYRTISETDLRACAKKYGASYAVLYPETSTSYPLVARTDRFKLVALEDPSPPIHPSEHLSRSSGDKKD